MRVPGIYLVLLYIFVGLAQDFEYQRRLLSLLFMCMPPSMTMKLLKGSNTTAKLRAARVIAHTHRHMMGGLGAGLRDPLKNPLGSVDTVSEILNPRHERARHGARAAAAVHH